MDRRDVMPEINTSRSMSARSIIRLIGMIVPEYSQFMARERDRDETTIASNSNGVLSMPTDGMKILVTDGGGLRHRGDGGPDHLLFVRSSFPAPVNRGVNRSRQQASR